MATYGDKSQAIKQVRFFKKVCPSYGARLARFRARYGKKKYWWYCWTKYEKIDPIQREDELLRHILKCKRENA